MIMKSTIWIPNAACWPGIEPAQVEPREGQLHLHPPPPTPMKVYLTNMIKQTSSHKQIKREGGLSLN